MNNKCIELLQQGSLVAFPTETVYGLGADATNPDAIRKVFAAKGRPADHPLIVHLPNIEHIYQWAINIPASAIKLAHKYWPGPLTLILQKHPNVDPLITGGQNTIALRIPNHPITLQLLKDFGKPLVGPSANKYGHVSPTTAQHVLEDLGDQVAAIIDGGPTDLGIESTIVSFICDHPQIVREGLITAKQLNIMAYDKQIKASGTCKSHYAPRTPIELFDEQVITALNNYSVISFKKNLAQPSADIYWETVATDQDDYAKNLYARLRKHDKLGKDKIFIEQVPSSWSAIKDRLSRAAADKN